MKRSNSNPTTTTSLTKRRYFRGWLKRVTLPNGNQRKVGPDNIPKGGVFGIPLTVSIKYAKTTVGYIDEDNVKHTKAGAIPIVVAKCCSYLKKNGLETEGIFRISGSVKRVNALEFQFDQSSISYGLDLNWEGYTVHDAASLLRRYLNKLHGPVIPFEYYQQFRDVMNNNAFRDTEQRIEAFQKLIQSLSPPHQHLLLYLLDTLSLFATTASSETKMDIPNLAAIFCPGILRHPHHNTPIQYKISQYVIEFLIEFQSLFTMQLLVPSSKRKKPSTTGSENPPVPLLLPSSSYSPKHHQIPNTPPQVPLHVVNNSSAPSIQSPLSSLVANNNSSSFIESPVEINQPPSTEERKIHSTTTTTTTTTKESLMHQFTKVTTIPYYLILCEKFTEFRHTIEPWIAKPAALLICFSVLVITLVVIVYEAYLAITLVIFEPLLFFMGLISYWGLLYHSLPSTTTTTTTTTAVFEKEHIAVTTTDTTAAAAVIEKEEEEAAANTTTATATTTTTAEEENDEQEDIETMYPAMDDATEEAMMQDESIMSECRELLTRAWKVKDEDGSSSSSSAASIFAVDNESVMSRSSRFNEEEDFSPPPTGSISSSDDEEELGFDPDTLEMYLSQYDQIKQDAELAKQLQLQEQKACDENNPFVVVKEEEEMTMRKQQPLKKIDSSDVSNSSSSMDQEDEVIISTPTTTNDKEEWKIRVFPRQ